MAAATIDALISGMITILQQKQAGLISEQQDLLDLLLEIQPLMSDAELHADGNQDVRTWLGDLKSAAYDADDILDEFRYINLKLEAGASCHRNVKKGCKIKPNSLRLLFNRGVKGKMRGAAKRIGKVNERIGVLVEKMRGFGFENGNGISQARAERLQELTLSSQIEIGIRNDEKEEIVQLLLNSSKTHEHKDVLGRGIFIVGEEGVGKTTLARLVCSDPQIKDHFECVLWVEVGQETNPARITKTIIDQTIGKDSGISEYDADLLQRGIYQQLSGKRYLLVLDDVRNDIQLDQFKLWLELDAGNGSSLLVTTCSRDLVQSFGFKSFCEHKMPTLEPNIIRALFSERASIADKDVCSEIREMGERIILQCGGSLLLVNLMGGLMRFKKGPAEWQEVVNQLENLRDGDTLSTVLRLCFDNLSSEVKQCFAFCSIFPVGHYMDQEMLIKLWMANGFISSDGSTSPEEKGNMVFNELVSRYFFEDVKVQLVDRGTYRNKHVLKSGVVCKMLNRLHDLAKSVAGSEYSTQSIEGLGSSTQAPVIRHLSITGHDSPLDLIVILKSYPSLRTLISPVDPFIRTVKSCSLLPGSSTLRVLHLHCALFEQDLFELKYMIHLRYLDLSGSRIKWLPESTCSLYNLQTLNLSKCQFLRRLPEDMRYMRSLRHLYIHNCPKLKKMPPYLSELSCLQTLTTYFVGEHMGNGIDQLKDMHDLSGLVELYDLRKVKDEAAAKDANLVSKTKLKSLTLCWGTQQLVMPKESYLFSEENELRVWEALKPPHNQLEVLKIQQYGCLDVPNWLDDPKGLHSLVELHLIGSSQWQILPAVWSLPSLQVLCLKHMVSLTCFCMYKSSSPLFPSLKRLVLADLKRLKRWNQEETEGSTSTCHILTIPKLDEMEITNCPELISMPKVPLLKQLTICIENHSLLHSVTSLIKSADNLVKANIGDAISEDMPFSLQTEAEGPNNHNFRTMRLDSANSFVNKMHRNILSFWKLLGSLENLEIFNCDQLVTFPLDELRNLNRLKRLSIRNCPNLTCFEPQEYARHFRQLVTLEIYGCPSLEKVPQFPSILALELDECPNVHRIPQLMELQILYLSCRSWTDLPRGIGRLRCLKSLRLSKCYNLNALPGEFSHLNGRSLFLRTLIINECPNLIDIPPNFEQVLSSLEEIKISRCPRLASFCREGCYSSIISRKLNLQ